MPTRHVKYNPAFLSEADLVENFVVRYVDLNLIVQIIKENNTQSNQHVLVIGPRGSGKTTLLHRVAAKINQTKMLRKRWYPLIFAEESYEVVSSGEFWLEALFHLGEQTGDVKWKDAYLELREEVDDQRLGARALALLLDFADSRSRRILLIVENLNMLFGHLTNKNDTWDLRHTLMNEPRLMLLASATNRFEQIENSSQAMFEMFKIQDLKPLNDDQCNRIWKQITGKPLAGERIRPIRILTGGNPRLLVIIAKFGTHRSFRQLLDDLVNLIDDHTEYFKSHLDQLPAKERKVYLSLAGLWDASTAREIAKAARLDVNKTSAYLKRLIGRGAVMVEDQQKKTKWYVIAERMYNIYYLMRRRGRPASRVRATVKFMVSLYDPESVTDLIAREACKMSPEMCTDHYLAYQETLETVDSPERLKTIIAATPQQFRELPFIKEALTTVMNIGVRSAIRVPSSTKDEITSTSTEAIIREGIRMLKSGEVKQGLGKIGGEIGHLISSHLDHDPDIFIEVLSVLGELIERNTNEECVEFQENVGKTMLIKGLMLRLLERPEEAIAVCDEVLSCFGEATETVLREQMAMAMVNKGITLGDLERPEDAIAVYDEVLSCFGEATETVLREQVASAMIKKGITLGHLDRPEEEIAVCDEVLSRFGEAAEPVLREQVAIAMVNKGATLGRLERPEDAIAVYDEVLVRFGGAAEPVLREQVASAMINKANTLGRLERSKDAIAVYDEVLARFGETAEPVLREKVAMAMAMVNKGITLGDLERPEDAIAVYDEVLARFGENVEAVLREKVASAMVNKGNTLGNLERSEDAIAVYEEVLARFGESAETVLREKVASAMVNKGITLGHLERPEDAIAVYDEVLARFGEDRETVLRKLMAEALTNKGVQLCETNEFEAAETAFHQAIEIFPSLSAPAIQLIKLFLKKPEKIKSALALAGDMIDQKPADSALRNGVAWVLYEHGDPSLLSKAKDWSQQAVSLSPHPAYHYTLACILSALGKGEETLKSARHYMQDTVLVKKSIEDAIELFVALSASGKGKEALDILENSSVAEHLEPLIIGIKLYIGEEVKTAVEIREVAKDVVIRIEEQVKRWGHDNLVAG